MTSKKKMYLITHFGGHRTDDECLTVDAISFSEEGIKEYYRDVKRRNSHCVASLQKDCAVVLRIVEVEGRELSMKEKKKIWENIK